MKIYYMEQRSPEWYQVRKLHFTASDANTILAMGKGLDTLVRKKLAEYYSSGNFEEFTDNYVNSNMQRGIEYEDKARTIYEFETTQTVEQVGFVELNEYVGCSPDGLVGDNGLIEIKNHKDDVFLDLIDKGQIDKKYYDQIQMQLYVTGRMWCDYFAFNPNFSPCYVKIRIERSAETFAKLDEALPYATSLLLKGKEKFDKVLQPNLQVA